MSEWQDISTAPIGEMVWLWAPAWRHAFPGMRIADSGLCLIDTCEPKAMGWETCASYWMPMSSPEPPK